MRRPITKEERIAARYIPAAYTIYRETKDGIVYSGMSDTPIKGKILHGIAFRGSAMNCEWHYNFRSQAQLEEETAKFFNNLDAHRKYQEERRATRNKGETDTQKVKKALKAAGYNVTSVHRDTGTASHWIDITIDDYDEYIDKDGYRQRRYGDVMQIAKVASGREHLHDDISTDLFMVNITVNFTKYHRCSECLISNCTEYHTPDSCARGCFYSKEMAAWDEIHREQWRREEEQKKIALSLVELDPCGDRLCDECEIGGCEATVKAATPPGYVPYLKLSIVEESV
jgi:hypothetical protein